ncbi:MAG: F0F1 ATP synthase subunit delta [bacterium]|nr:F0F1 ATP synthase subunit delta [bacterium]
MKTKILKLAKKSLQASFAKGRLEPALVSEQIKVIKKEYPSETLNLLRAYRKLLRAKLAKQTVLVESSLPLNQDLVADIEAEIKKKFGADKTVTFRTNETTLGGLRLKLGDDILDYSLAGKLNELKEAFSQHG